jgi:hypothetical protein
VSTDRPGCRATTADEWNAQYPPGTPVTWWPAGREGKALEGVTASKAWTRDGMAIVAIAAPACGIALTDVEPRSA